MGSEGELRMSVREVFNSHLRESFSRLPEEVGDMESEWTMSRPLLRVPGAVTRSSVLVAVTGGNPGGRQP